MNYESFDHLASGIVVRDAGFNLSYWNRAFLSILGEAGEDFNGELSRFMADDDLERLGQSEGFSEVYTLYADREIWVWERAEKLDSGLFLSVIDDVTESRQELNQLKDSEERYRRVFERTEDILFEWDFVADTISFSDRYQKVFGNLPITNQVSRNPAILSRIHPDDVAMFLEWIKGTFRRERPITGEFRLMSSENEYIWMRCRSTAVLDDEGKPIKAVGIFNNINKQRSAMDYLKRKSQQDSLTKLYNKEETKTHIQAALANSRGRGVSALLMVDIDNFKGVNDQLGHQFGDTVLMDVSSRIKRLFRETDIIGRLGGDEFAVFLPYAPSEKVVHEKAEALIQALRNTYFGEVKQYKLSGSVGAAIAPHHGTTFEELYRNADAALYECKRRGKDGYAIYDRQMAHLPESCTGESSRRFLAEYFAGDPTYNVFEMLYETRDIKTTINMILGIMGRKFKVDRAYIVELAEGARIGGCSYSWQNEESGELAAAYSAALAGEHDMEGIFFANDVGTLDKEFSEPLLKKGVRAHLQCCIFDEGRLWGFIGFDDCSGSRAWRGEEIATLGYVSRILSVFLAKKHMSKELLESYGNYCEILDNLSGFVYVIDALTYQTYYLNKATEGLGVRVGETCHKAAFGMGSPCDDCPIRSIKIGEKTASSKIFSVKLNCWVTSTASRIKWNGRDAYLICCNPAE